jgi:hypothetical protein
MLLRNTISPFEDTMHFSLDTLTIGLLVVRFLPGDIAFQGRISMPLVPPA